MFLIILDQRWKIMHPLRPTKQEQQERLKMNGRDKTATIKPCYLYHVVCSCKNVITQRNKLAGLMCYKFQKKKELKCALKLLIFVPRIIYFVDRSAKCKT